MALRGTLSDFGIADIFQLVGHQTKTGILLLKNREQEVRISFVDGNVVKAMKASRDRADLLGNIMVRARVLTNEQLDDALLVQQRTMRRLGDVLVEKRYVDLETLRQFTRLQTTETIYRLFAWEAGTYEFTASDNVDHDPVTQAPIRAEEILMEAFRMIDEWPSVRKVISSNAMLLFKQKELPPPSKKGNDDGDDLLSGLDDAFDAMESGSGAKDDDDDDSIGANARLVFSIVTDGCSAQDVVDLSRIGEFEACKALVTLVEQGYLRVEHPKDAAYDLAPIEWRKLAKVVPLVLARVVAYAVLALVVGGLIRLVDREPSALSGARSLVVSDGVWLESAAARHQEKLEMAVRIHTSVVGPPRALDDLVSTGIIAESDARGPFHTAWVLDDKNTANPVARPLR